MSKVIDLDQYRTPGIRVYAGRERGARVRADALLDQFDKDGEEVTVKIPEDSFSVNSSFFLGMFGPSIRLLKEEKFRERYKFEGKNIARVINECIKEALRTGSPLPESSD
jgi:hypothetical protein